MARVLLVFLLPGCDNIFVNPPANDPEAVFENLWNTFNEEYAPFEERQVDWQAEYTKYHAMVDQETTEAELFSILSQLLATLDDGHVSLTAPGREVFFSNKVRREQTDDELFDLNVIKSYLEAGYKTDSEDAYIYGKIKNAAVAYIFFDHVGENFFKIHDFLNEYENVNGYIIDMRHNQGGDFTYCFTEIGRLTNENRYVFQSKTKNGPGPGDYTGWQKWFIEPTGDYVDKPIVVLTDRHTISAGERSVMAFMTLPNVLVMGDTTNGAHGTMIGRELANGWYYSVVPQKVEMFDGKTYEGIGLAPDVFIKNTTDQISAGIDQVLQQAIDHLK